LKKTEPNWNKDEKPAGYAYEQGAERERNAVDGEPAAVLELWNRTTEKRFEETADLDGAGRLGAWIGEAMIAGGKPW